MIRRFGSAPDPDRRYRPRPGIYAVLAAEDGLLATFQEAPWPELQLPGGGVDPGEQPLHALHREVREETGHAIAAPRRLGAFRRFTYMPEYDLFAEKLCHVYLARVGRRLGPPLEPGHHAVFVPWEVAAERLAVPGDRHFCRRAARMLGIRLSRGGARLLGPIELDQDH